MVRKPGSDRLYASTLYRALFRDSDKLITAEYPLFVFSVFRKPQQISSFRSSAFLWTLKALTDCTQEAARKDVWAKMSSSSLNESSFMTPVNDSIPIPAQEQIFNEYKLGNTKENLRHMRESYK